MSRITIIPPDGVVGKDGVFFRVDLSAYPSIHAVQFDTVEGKGTIELTEGCGSLAISDLGSFTPALDAWDAAAALAAQPIESVPPAPVALFSSLDFLELFTQEEQLAVVTATLGSPTVKLWYDKMLAANFIDLNDPRTAGGVTALVLAGLLTPQRATTILTPV
jgi:hypothetical protein